MPTYQYACTACGHAFEQVQSFSDDALTHCPVCDGRLRKVFNAVGVRIDELPITPEKILRGIIANGGAQPQGRRN